MLTLHNTEPILLGCKTNPGLGRGQAWKISSARSKGAEREEPGSQRLCMGPAGATLGHRWGVTTAPGAEDTAMQLTQEGEFGQGEGDGFPGMVSILGSCRKGFLAAVLRCCRLSQQRPQENALGNGCPSFPLGSPCQGWGGSWSSFPCHRKGDGSHSSLWGDAPECPEVSRDMVHGVHAANACSEPRQCYQPATQRGES